MKSFAIAALLGATSAYTAMDKADYEFMKFIAESGRSYGTKEEFEFRAALFKESLKEIEEWNADETNTSTMGLNFMSDMTADERKKYLGLVYNEPLPDDMVEEAEDDSALASSMDWRSKGAVTGVKNQGQCGSCWAFSTVGSVEGYNKIKHGHLTSLSEQELVDCDKSDSGCNGGLMTRAFKYVESKGLETESQYPYNGRSGTCKANKAENSAVKISGFKRASRSSAGLKTAISHGPTSVSIEADQSVFQRYSGGVITKGCGSNLDHGVLAVGYGSSSDCKDYAIVKNSWGSSWGSKGYVNICMDQCGVTHDASYPI